MGYNLDPKKISNEEWLFTNCKERSLYIIENSNKTEKQLRDKLKNSGKYSEEIINKTILFLKKYNYINDYEYTKRFIEKFKNKYSKKVLIEKLYQKGVKKTIIDEVVNNFDFENDEYELAKRILLKKYPDYYENCDSLDNIKKNKLFAYLFRKGFNYELVQKILNIDAMLD